VSVDRTSVDHTRFGPESRSWTFFGLYDGHNGTGANLELSNRLPSLVIEVLMNLYNNFNNDFEFDTLGSNGEARMRDPPGEHIDDAIKHAFVSMDEYLVRHIPEQTLTDGASSATPRALAVWSLDSAWAGSTALLAFYDEQTRQLRMSCTGSSRAVLGRETKASNGQVKYELHTLSQDQTPDNPEEVARIKREHPQENHLFHDGRLLGIRPTRSFGDLQLKAGRTTLERIHDVLGGPPVQEHVLTPPYVTAEPVITTTDIQPGDFLIVATDGLWEWLTSAEAVGLVGVWLNQNERGVTKSGYDSPLSREALPVTKLDEDKTKMYKRWGAEKRFVNVDDNCASHLVRNALGSANVDVAAALMSSIAPRARAYR
jgi:pyruvate dehydrogenase phosphatase